MSKFIAIREYISEMKKDGLRNANYTLILLDQLRKILLRFESFSSTPRVYKRDLKSLLDADLFRIIYDIHEVMREECYTNLHSRYLDLLLEIFHLSSKSGRLGI